MPTYYQDPAQYYSQRQGRNDQKFSQMLQMMMQMQRLKQQKGQFKHNQEMKQQQLAFGKDQLASIDRYRKAQEKQWAKPPKPPDWWTLAQSLVATQQAPDMGTAIMMAKNIKKEKSLEEKVTEAGSLADVRAAAQAKYRQPPKVEDEGPTPLTPAQKLTNRRLIKSNINSRWTNILKDEEIRDKVEFYRASDNIHIDMPKRYTVFQSFAKEGVAKPEELEYIAKAELTKAFLDGHPNIYTLDEIAPAARAKLDLATIKTVFEYREKPRNKIFGIF